MESVPEKHCGIYCIDRIENVDKYKSASCLFHVDKMQILSFCLLMYVALVAIYGGFTSSPAIILKQGAPALVALIYSFVLL